MNESVYERSVRCVKRARMSEFRLDHAIMQLQLPWFGLLHPSKFLGTSVSSAGMMTARVRKASIATEVSIKVTK